LVFVFNRKKMFKPSYAVAVLVLSCNVVYMLPLFLYFGAVNFCYYKSKINFQFVRVKQCDCEAVYCVSNIDSSSISNIFFSREAMVSFVFIFTPCSVLPFLFLNQADR